MTSGISGERQYVCETCNGSGLRRVARDCDLNKPCLTCDGQGYISESKMERLMHNHGRPLFFDWRLFVRER